MNLEAEVTMFSFIYCYGEFKWRNKQMPLFNTFAIVVCVIYIALANRTRDKKRIIFGFTLLALNLIANIWF